MSVRILHVATRHRVGGAERNLRHTVSAEASRGFRVHVAVGVEGLVNDFPCGVHVHHVPDLVRELSPTRDARAFRRLGSIIHEHDFDVVHTHQSKAGVLGRVAAYRNGKPLIVHTVHMPSFGPGYSRPQDLAFRSAERMLAMRTDCSIFVGTDLMRRYLDARAAHADRAWVIRSPIFNLDGLIALRERSEAERERDRNAMGLPATMPMILAVGALDGRKRHQMLVRLLAPLLKAGEATLVIAGQGPEWGDLEALRAELGLRDALVLRGFVPDVVPLYGAADVFVQTSTTEGVPQTIVQAVAAAVPIVVTDVDGVREVAVGQPHATLVPLDGSGMVAAVRAKLHASRPAPASAAALEEWRPARVSDRLRTFHEWLGDRVRSRRRAASRSAI